MGRALILLAVLGLCIGCSAARTGKDNAGLIGQFDDILDYDSPPVLVTAVRPDYPDMAREIGAHGRVVLKALILEDGRIGAIQILESPNPILLDQAITALRKSVFSPATKGGVPCKATAVIPFIFDIGNATLPTRMGQEVDKTRSSDPTTFVEPPAQPPEDLKHGK